MIKNPEKFERLNSRIEKVQNAFIKKEAKKRKITDGAMLREIISDFISRNK